MGRRESSFSPGGLSPSIALPTPPPQCPSLATRALCPSFSAPRACRSRVSTPATASAQGVVGTDVRRQSSVVFFSYTPADLPAPPNASDEEPPPQSARRGFRAALPFFPLLLPRSGPGPQLKESSVSSATPSLSYAPVVLLHPQRAGEKKTPAARAAHDPAPPNRSRRARSRKSASRRPE